MILPTIVATKRLIIPGLEKEELPFTAEIDYFRQFPATPEPSAPTYSQVQQSPKFLHHSPSSINEPTKYPILFLCNSITMDGT